MKRYLSVIFILAFTFNGIIFAQDSATGSFNNSSSATFFGRSRGTDNVMSDKNDTLNRISGSKHRRSSRN